MCSIRSKEHALAALASRQLRFVVSSYYIAASAAGAGATGGGFGSQTKFYGAYLNFTS